MANGNGNGKRYGKGGGGGGGNVVGVGAHKGGADIDSGVGDGSFNTKAAGVKGINWMTAMDQSNSGPQEGAMVRAEATSKGSTKAQ
jgi:hypothetical protein